MDLQLDLLLKFLIAIGLGALIGAEREMSKAKDLAESVGFAGLRTHTLVAILGFVGTYLGKLINPWILIILLVAMIAFFLAQYLNKFRKSNLWGITSEMAAIISFLVGVLAFYEPLLAVILAVVTTLILKFKKPLHGFIDNLESVEFLSTIKFIIVAFVILPILPKEPIDPWGWISPFEVWLMVVFISAISFIGYILIKLIGTKKGLGLTALLGGLASSTATTISMAQQGAKNKKIITPFIFAIVITSTVMFGRQLLEVSVLNPKLLPHLILTFGSMIGMSLIILIILNILEKRTRAKTEELALTSPFRLLPALKFGLLYILILIISQVGHRYFGQNGVYIASFLAGLADVDVITLSLSKLSSEAKMTTELAVQGITIAVMTNTLVKLAFVRIFGTALLFRWFALALLPIFLVGIGMLFFI